MTDYPIGFFQIQILLLYFRVVLNYNFKFRKNDRQLVYVGMIIVEFFNAQFNFIYISFYTHYSSTKCECLFHIFSNGASIFLIE